MSVCQPLFNCQMKQQQNMIYGNVYWNVINDSYSQTSLLPKREGVVCMQAST